MNTKPIKLESIVKEDKKASRNINRDNNRVLSLGRSLYGK